MLLLQAEVPFPDLPVKIHRLGLHPVRRRSPAVEPPETRFRVDVEEKGAVRNEPSGGEGVQSVDVRGVDPAGESLVDGGGVEEPVGKDGLPRGEGGEDHRVNVLGARRLVEEQFGLGEDLLLARREDESPDFIGQGGSPGFAGEDVGNPFRRQVLRQKLDLRRLAGPLDPLECDERGPQVSTPKTRTSGT